MIAGKMSFECLWGKRRLGQVLAQASGGDHGSHGKSEQRDAKRNVDPQKIFAFCG
jgi:hypothetical protein